MRAGKLNGATAWLVVVVHRQAKLGGDAYMPNLELQSNYLIAVAPDCIEAS